jgi:hypothetical protein
MTLNELLAVNFYGAQYGQFASRLYAEIRSDATDNNGFSRLPRGSLRSVGSLGWRFSAVDGRAWPSTAGGRIELVNGARHP